MVPQLHSVLNTPGVCMWCWVILVGRKLVGLCSFKLVVRVLRSDVYAWQHLFVYLVVLMLGPLCCCPCVFSSFSTVYCVWGPQGLALLVLLHTASASSACMFVCFARQSHGGKSCVLHQCAGDVSVWLGASSTSSRFCACGVSAECVFKAQFHNSSGTPRTVADLQSALCVKPMPVCA